MENSQGYFIVTRHRKESKASTPDNRKYTNYLQVEIVKANGNTIKVKDPVFLNPLENDYLDLIGVEVVESDII